MTTPRPEPDLRFITADGRDVAVRHRPADPERSTVLFLPGYASDMAGGKALAIDAWCAERGVGCLRFDYSGTGESPGAFAEGTLARWLDEALAAIDQLVPEGRMIVAGSSMGGWLALHAALRRPERVAGLLGIAAAPDFTQWGYSAEEQATILRDGKFERPNPYGPEPSVTHAGFWHSGQALRLLEAPIEIAIPVRLVHGDRDAEVPVTVALQLVERLRSADVQLKLIKGGGHRLSEPHEIAAILAELAALVESTDR